jgi:hypothetical protein
VTVPHGIPQAHQRCKVGVAAAHEYQVLRHLLLSWFERPWDIGVGEYRADAYNIL